MNIDECVEKLIRKVFRLNEEKIDKNWTSSDIQDWDSLGHLTLVIAIEKEFNVKFEIEETFQIRSVGDISQILEKKLKR